MLRKFYVQNQFSKGIFRKKNAFLLIQGADYEQKIKYDSPT